MTPQGKRVVRIVFVIYASFVIILSVYVGMYVSIAYSSSAEEPWFAYFILPGGALCLFVPGCIHGGWEAYTRFLLVLLNILAYVGVPLVVVRIIRALNRWTARPAPSGT